MRIRRRAFLCPSFILAFSAAVVGAAPTRAGVVLTASFDGTVTGPSGTGVSLPPGVSAGNSFTGGFTYNTGQVATASSGLYTFTTVTTGNSQAFSFNVLGTGFGDAYSPSFGTYTIKITDNVLVGSTKETEFDMHAITEVQKTVSGSTEQAFIDLVFYSTTYTGTALPSTSAAFSMFNLSAGQLTWDPFGDIGFTGPASVNTLLQSGSVPEPSSIVLGIIAMATGTVGFFMSRRKASRV